MALFSSSPWRNDAWLTRDLFHSEGDTNQDENLSTSSQRNDTSHSFYCSPSLGGSECSDDLFMEDDDLTQSASDDQLEGLLSWGLDATETDIMQQTMLNILGESPLMVGDDDFVVSLDAVEPPASKSSTTSSRLVCEFDSGAESTVPSAPPSPQCKKSKVHRRRAPRSSRSWDEMSNSEQLSIAEELSIDISQQLGLREQLEVIGIINPTASVQPKDTQFVIELSWLSESKLQKVREYLERQQRKTHDASSSSNNSSNNKRSNSQSRSKTGSVNPSPNAKRLKRKEQKIVRHREQRQVKKETRSGLFQREQVVSLSNCDPDSSSDEIDILT
ncbi:hypothetical protein CAPTEDRAFT_224762 [Capitella teleta]|uniref:Uncharacterized protein n=1 Tax=Capitella teleta TaxID=283909 RepID=R7UUK2_CAPTE|nr:hypothetical protein CAPTEDRAFT_224762 [Capitella teleta]|eukprot:ELU10318.1 hypothetical protein CAPTEDRAFT_224762 [Capitella teleta]